MIDAYIFDVIIGKLSYWKGSSLIILHVVDKSPEIGLYCIVLPLSLAVNLRIKGGKKLLLDF